MHLHGYIQGTEEVNQIGHIDLGRGVMRNNEKSWIWYIYYNLFLFSEI